jgi:hypothetical protein
LAKKSVALLQQTPVGPPLREMTGPPFGIDKSRGLGTKES